MRENNNGTAILGIAVEIMQLVKIAQKIGRVL